MKKTMLYMKTPANARSMICFTTLTAIIIGGRSSYSSIEYRNVFWNMINAAIKNCRHIAHHLITFCLRIRIWYSVRD